MTGLAALLVVALAAMPAAADAGTIYLNPGQQSTVATMTLRAGDAVTYQWSGGLDVELVAETGGTEVFTATGPATQGTFTAPSDGTYVFSFRNNGTTMTGVAWNLERPAPSLATPLLIVGVAAAGIVGALAGVALWMRKRAKAPAPSPPQPPQ